MIEAAASDVQFVLSIVDAMHPNGKNTDIRRHLMNQSNKHDLGCLPCTPITVTER